ncbi:MAG: transcription antitermination factor NusB [Arcanobacterium sp.]|nr:transcription antitermination factor NusB [Arcanobacterium sp.]
MSKTRPSNWRPGRRQHDYCRELAYEILLTVETEDAYANLVVPQVIKHANLGKQDAAYVTNLSYGTIRLQGRWDAIIAHCIGDKTLSDLDIEVLLLLRLGAYQLLELKTPAHAAIYEMVMLTRNLIGTGASGFVNAVLRRISERSTAQWRDVLLEANGGKASSLDFLSAWFSHPCWIISSYLKTLKETGREPKELLSVLKANNTPAPVSLVAREISIKSLETDIQRGKMSSSPPYLVDSALTLENGDPHRIFAVKDKLAGVQDEGSQLVAKIFANIPITQPDSQWLDLCAGPGGKTATLAALAAQRGAEIYANELHEHRLNLVAQGTLPWSDIVHLRQGDGREIGTLEPNVYDRVLVDVPCSGIGALRRRPEARWRKTAGDILDLAVLQKELLLSGFKATRVGGITAYVTCSSHLSETRDVVMEFLAEYENVELLDISEVASQSSLREISLTKGMLQLWPDLHRSDAMFMAVLQKTASASA